MNIPDESVVGPVCISNIHIEDVPATVRGTWMPYQNLPKVPGVWYCEKCAVTAEAYRLFTRDEADS